MSGKHRMCAIALRALFTVGIAGAASEGNGAELFPYNPPASAAGSPVPGVPVSQQFYEDFGNRAKTLVSAEREKLRSALYQEMNKAVQRGDIARAQYYSNLIKSAGF